VSMTGYRRVRAALTWQRPDYLPAGEFELDAAAVARLEADTVGVLAGNPGWTERLAFWAGRDLFVWAIVDGPFQQQFFTQDGRGEWLAGLVRPALVESAGRALGLAGQAIELGADGVVLGEDVAYSEGLFCRPGDIQENLAPLWAEFTAEVGRCRTRRCSERPLVMLHSDGRVHEILDLVVSAGFDGHHSLEPEAGMDPEVLLARYRGRLAFWGGLSLPRLFRSRPEEIAADVQRLVAAGRDGGLVLGTSSGLVPEGLPARSLVLAYAARRWGVGSSSR